MTNLARHSLTSLVVLTVSLFLALGAFFILVPSASAADLYWVGTNPANFGTAADWNTTDPGACNAGGGNASAAPTNGDRIILDADCDTSLNLDGSVTLLVSSAAGYSGTLTLTNDWTTAGGGGQLAGLALAGGTLDTSGSSYDIEVRGDWDVESAATFTSNSSTVSFVSNSGQVFDTGGGDANHDFYNVVINNTATLGGNDVELGDGKLMVNNNFTITDGVVAANNQDIEVTATFSIADDGALSFEGTETFTFTTGADTDSGTVYVNNTTANSPYGNAFYNLTIIPGNTFTLPATTDVNGAVSIGSGAGIATGGNDMTVAGNWSNSGTFTHGSAQVTFDGSSDQRLSGDTTFYDIVAAASSARTLEIASGDTMTVANSLSLNGASGSLLSVEATTGGSAATIAASGATESTSFLSLKDITLTGQVILCDPGCINRGGNPGWIIPAEATDLPSLSSVQVMSPNGGERWTVGGAYEITWDLRHDDVETVSVSLSDDGGNTWELLAEDLENSGSYSFTMPDMPSLKAKVQVAGFDADGVARLYDLSDRTFTIEVAEEEGETEEGSEEVLSFSDVTLVDVNGNDVVLTPGGLFRGETLSGVCYVNADGTRSVFPNATVFDSHGFSFDDVVMVRDDQLQRLDLGRRMTMAPGRLVKIQSDNRVFEVGPDGLLHHVPSEAVAIERYGETWNQQITDIDVTFWSDYPVGVSL